MRNKDEPFLALRGIAKSFGGVFALQGVDFTLNQGEIHGLVGENGAGKSTLMKIIAGSQTDFQGAMVMDGAPVRFRSPQDTANLSGLSLRVSAGEILGVYGFMGSGHGELGQALIGKTKVRAGQILISEKPLRVVNTSAARRAGIAYIPESRRQMLFAVQPVYKNISISILDRLGRILLRPGRERQIASQRIAELSVRPPRADGIVASLSGGNQQKVALARWLTHLPKVLILNEPTRGMDVGAKEDVVKIVRSIKEKGVAVILVSTEPELILALSDRIAVVRKGRISREFTDETVSKDRLLATA
jgi:ribose transport system ATP-binding protein